MPGTDLPPIPYEQWRPCLDTVHRFAQIVGKVRLAAAARQNHWWHVALRLTGRGLTSRPTGTDPIFTIDLDLVDHRLDIMTVDGRRASFELVGLSVADFWHSLMALLTDLGIAVEIDQPYPYDLPDAGRPFAEDSEHAGYDPDAVARAFQVLSWAGTLFERFAADWSGKTSPVHLFWHSFDLAVTRFSDRRVNQPASVGRVTREGYSRELISVGFWFGDPTFPEPAFYSYTAPEPDGLAGEQLEPESAFWRPTGGGHTAMLRYDDARAAADPDAAVLGFLGSAYRAGAHLAGWDRTLESPGGVTDLLA